MPVTDYAKVAKEGKRSQMSSFLHWVQLKKYQYEVTFSLYMLTPTEKCIFNLILFLLVSLLVTAATLYLPNHLVIIYHRICYYISGEFAYKSSTNLSQEAAALTADGLRVASGAIESVVTPTLRAVEAARETLREL
ncbi:hypothetical protein AYO21_11585 [Fonsecaea monophora]|uniref:Unplaced genomic scaffold supercont1.7, whole genome shotgun sequence n=3 Tax=Fonsecaea TaxID=40354 RepID=A0A0D2GA29_9EURO|nr:uncharacterized protein Z517_10427 [Fonsecaea pedrosoi CBS 271.37]XP_022502850.1 hypothetical protein AYO20_03015 [Fonsecaea nubica]XP_022506224.1 hypothetical protein AYO21_11585 [Fonsecaea monophora]KIW75685.1 hypothetical protein Z517_10427 [Fonsecaea pedrosoi CBS 271.37]OAG34272.1 hypothetical protein AYO21_11585 [Fonsecaea monophora]OAL37838.1 hypothetical protein AYO20_03015 [Fonsecaea nubica]